MGKDPKQLERLGRVMAYLCAFAMPCMFFGNVIGKMTYDDVRFYVEGLFAFGVLIRYATSLPSSSPPARAAASDTP